MVHPGGQSQSSSERRPNRATNSASADPNRVAGGLNHASLPKFRHRRPATGLSRERLQLIVREIASLREYKQRLADTTSLALERRQMPLYERLSGCLATVRSMMQLFFRYYCLHSGTSAGAALPEDR